MPHFIERNFCFLDGVGHKLERSERFHGATSCLQDGETVITDEFVRKHRGSMDVPTFLQNQGQRIFNNHEPYSYHGAPPPNRIIRDIHDFMLGFELEVITKSPALHDAITQERALRSNWFTLQYDGSLPSCGVEIVSCPLPLEHLRDIKFWNQVCQGFSKYVTSRLVPACGLHFHVNVEYFIDPKAPRSHENQRAATAFFLAFVYNKLRDFLSNGFLTDVFGRPESQYCVTTNFKPEVQTQLNTLSKLKEVLPKRYYTKVKNIPNLNPLLNVSKHCTPVMLRESLANPPRHYSELNLWENIKTYEFRRGKGTVDPASIHMQVELIYLLCSYVKNSAEDTIIEGDAWHLIQFIIRNTKSALLLYYINKRCPQDYKSEIPSLRRIEEHPMTGMSVSTKLELGGKHAKQPVSVYGDAVTNSAGDPAQRTDTHNNAE